MEYIESVLHLFAGELSYTEAMNMSRQELVQMAQLRIDRIKKNQSASPESKKFNKEIAKSMQ